MKSLNLTEKQQEVLWLRYGKNASVDQVARWLNITRRAVLNRLRNAERRASLAGIQLPISAATPETRKTRLRTEFPADAGESREWLEQL